MFSFSYVIWIIGAFFIFYIITQLRKVVPTNEAHVVQKWKKSISYWKDSEWWNVYLAWPSWVPIVWVAVQKLPLSIFALQLTDYKAYDIWKVPFQVDITAFFEIKNPELAAQKVYSIEELRDQLNETLKWVVRKILASKDIVEIMESRTEIKKQFYEEIWDAVKSWWIDLKNVEFMDIKDSEDSEVVTNIMMKKKSLIEAESRQEVALNQRDAEIAEENARSEARSSASKAKSIADIISSDAEREANLKKIENDKLTQNQEIEKERVLAVQKEEARQKLYETQKETKIKELSIKQLELEKNAEISKNIELIKANEQKQKTIIDTEAWKEKIELEAQADRIKVELRALADKARVELEAEAESNKLESIWLAKAKEIDYIWTAHAKNKKQMAEALNMFTPTSIDFMKKELEVKLSEIVDLEKAKALSKADIKVISTWENWWEWVKNFMDLFSSRWWSNIWAMIESAKNIIWEKKVNEFLTKISPEKKVNETWNKVISEKKVNETWNKISDKLILE